MYKHISLTFINILTAISIPLNCVVAEIPVNKITVSAQPVKSFTKSIDQFKQVAKQQNITLVEYSIVTEEFTVAGKRQTQESELYIWVIKPTGEVVSRQIDLKPLWQKESTSLANLIVNTRKSMGVSSGVKGKIQVEPIKGKDSSNANLKKLHQLLIQPIADALPSQPNEHVIFLPQDKLFLVPFAALQDANGKYLIEKHTIATAPSIQVLDLLYQRQMHRGKKQFKSEEILIVGNPTVSNLSIKSGEESCKLSTLPGAEKEAKAIAQIFNTQALTGDAATETAVVQRMQKSQIIHLATYAFVNECQTKDSPGVIALATSQDNDGWLTSQEIQNLNLKADLVVLSSCDTALGKITGDGVIGLSRAFLTAGTTSVIGSLWYVDDSATASLMTEFYENFSKNPDKAAALRYSMLATMKKYPNPKEWAGFTLIGLH